MYLNEAVKARSAAIEEIISAWRTDDRSGMKMRGAKRQELFDAYEFGTNAGAGLKRVVEMFEVNHVSFGGLYGFDSFEGMPVDTSSEQLSTKYRYSAHALSTLARTGLSWAVAEEQIKNFVGYRHGPTTLIKGYFNETLTPTLRQEMGMRPAFFVSIDVDIFQSTMTVLTWLLRNGLLVKGTYVYYDEFDDGEGPAHARITADWGLRWRELYRLPADAADNPCCGTRVVFQLL